MPTPRSLALLLFALLACSPPPAPAPAQAPGPVTAPAPEASDEPLLRTYTVPPEQSRAIERALTSALQTGNDLPPLGTVKRLPDGRLVVVAPPGIHSGVEAMLRDLDPSKAPPVRTAEFDYWIVMAEPAGAAEGIDAVPDIAPALQAIVQSQGPMKFKVFESMRLSSLIDDSGEASGDRMHTRQVVSELGGKLVADLELMVETDPAGQSPRHFCPAASCKQLKSRVHLEPGQLLVVGQTGVRSREGKAEAVPKTMFYVVRGQLRTGAA